MNNQMTLASASWRSFYGIDLVVREETPGIAVDLAGLLDDLSFVTTPEQQGSPVLRLEVQQRSSFAEVFRDGRELFRRDGQCAYECGDDVYLEDGLSVLHLRGIDGRGTAYLACDFAQRPPLGRQRFWAFALVHLLRHRGLYPLHAAALVTPGGCPLLVVGPSGCGKSTLALGLVRAGARYLSDDAVVLRSQAQGIETLAFRRPFSLAVGVQNGADHDAGAAILSPEHRKQRFDVRSAFPELFEPACFPRVLLFPRITYEMTSELRPMRMIDALGQLLRQSAPDLIDFATTRDHVALLRRLIGQTNAFELMAGRDLQDMPTRLLGLLEQQAGGQSWHE